AFTEILAGASVPELDNAALGAPGIVGFAGRKLMGEIGAHLEYVPYVAFLVLTAVSLLARRNVRPVVFVGLLWIAVYLGPTALTRNMQMYYFYEPLAGAVIILAVC